MHSAPPSDSPRPQRPSRSGHRLWIPASLVVLEAAVVLGIRLQPELETNIKGWMVAASVVVAAVLLFLWFVFLSRVRWRSRLLTVAALALVFFGLAKALRVDGTTSGIGLPRLAWRWSAARATPPAAAAQAPAGLPVAAPADMPDVPQFFGPNRDGVAPGTGLARDWKRTPPRELWRQPVGAGWSAFAVVGGRAFTQEQRGEHELVTCYEVLSGRLLWSQSEAVHFSEWQGGDGPRATPTVHEGRVFAMGATGILNCLEAGSGRVVWRRDVLKENALENLTWGVSVSPLVFEDTVVVTGGMNHGPTVLAFRRSDGEPLWKSGSDKASYASPVLATLAGRRVILSFNAGSLTAHDPQTGEQLLSYPWSDDKRPKASQPVVLANDRVFISSGYGTGCALLQIRAEAGGKLSATQIWKSIRMKTQFNSAAAHDAFLYGLDDGLLACVDLATGERRWKEGRYGAGQSLLAGSLIIIQSEPGAVVLAAARPEGFEELGRIPALSAKTWNHPTLAGRYLLVRNSEEMACYELPLEK